MKTVNYKDSLLGPQVWLSISFLFLSAAVFLGNTFIGLGHFAAFLGILLLVVIGPRERLCWERLRKSSMFLIAFSVAVILSIFANYHRIEQPFDYLKKIRYELLIVFFLLLPSVRLRLFKTQNIRDKCIGVWLISFALTTTIGLSVFFSGKPLPFLEGVGHPGRASGIYGQVMTFAYSLQFTVLILTAFVVRKKMFQAVSSIPWIVLFPFFVLSGVSLYFSYSRGAVISVGIALMIFAAMQSRLLLLGVLVLGVLVGTYAYHDKWAYTDRPLYFRAEDPVRLNQWKASTLAFLENPIFGLGYRQFEPNSVRLKERYGIDPAKDVVVEGVLEKQYFRGHAHNNYLEAFASTGLFGGISFLGFCVCWLCESLKAGKYASLLVPLVLAFLFSGFFENTFNDSEVRNAILLIYFFSQVLMDRESEVKDY